MAREAKELTTMVSHITSVALASFEDALLLFTLCIGGGCGGVSLSSGDTAFQLGVGIGGGASGSYGIDPIDVFLTGAYNNTPMDPMATVPAGGMYWQDPLIFP
jgi:hypothetical protein